MKHEVTLIPNDEVPTQNKLILRTDNIPGILSHTRRKGSHIGIKQREFYYFNEKNRLKLHLFYRLTK